MPENPSAVKRCTVSPWWRGSFARGVYGWEHTRMGLRSICDFYWAAQTLTLEGTVTSTQTGELRCEGTSQLLIEPYELLIYQPRFCTTLPTPSGAYDLTGAYVFSQPLHWDGLNKTFCPEMALTLTIGHTVTPDEDENLGYVSLDPAVGAECGRAYLLLGFNAGLELPLYYDRGGVLSNVEAVAILTGTRWVFED